MMRLVLAGVWSALVALGSAYAVLSRHGETAEATSAAAARDLEQVRTKVMSVPVIAEGQVQGYVVAQFLFTIDRNAARDVPQPVNAFLSDGAFRTLYAGEKIDFRSLQRQDLMALGKTITETVNARVKAPLVHSVLIQDISYLTKDEIRRGKQP